MEIKTANDLYRIAKEFCIRNMLVKEDSPFSKQIYLPRIACKDGWTVSIQAGSCCYSIPREDLAKEYAGFELGYPSEREPLLDRWAEDNRWDESSDLNYTECIYPFTPVEVVDAVLEKHGGIDHVVS